MILGDLPQRNGFADAGAREQNVDLALLSLDRLEQAVEIVEIGRVALDAGYVAANLLDGLIERLLLTARHENVCPFFHEQLGACQRHAVGSARDHCNFAFKLSHDDFLFHTVWLLAILVVTVAGRM